MLFSQSQAGYEGQQHNGAHVDWGFNQFPAGQVAKAEVTSKVLFDFPSGMLGDVRNEPLRRLYLSIYVNASN